MILQKIKLICIYPWLTWRCLKGTKLKELKMKMQSEIYQWDIEGVLTNVRWIKLLQNSWVCLYWHSQHNHTVVNQQFNISAWNKGTLLWLALTFARFQCRSAFSKKLQMERIDGCLTEWYKGGIWHVPSPVAFKLQHLVIHISLVFSQLLLYYLVLWELIKVWTVRYRRMSPDFSPNLLVNSAFDHQFSETVEPTRVQM